MNRSAELVSSTRVGVRECGSAELDLAITDAEIAATFDPFVDRRFECTNEQWRHDVAKLARDLRLARLRHFVSRWLPGRRRTQASVNFNYDRQWRDRPLEQQIAVDGPTVPCEWRADRMYARATGTRRVHLLFLTRVIARLKPRHVLEVGCGNGTNVLVLAGRFPDVRFTGLELTSGGVDAAARVWKSPLSAALRAYSPEPVVDDMPAERLAFVRANALALPFVSASFDLVFTALALEQMEEIRPLALAELRRVAQSHVAMIEPFREWNEEGCARDFIVANDYFAGRIADLPQCGLRPMLATADMPAKLTLRAGLVVCAVQPK